MARRRTFDWNAVNEKIKALDKKPTYSNDEDFYKPKTDEHGNANVLLRFLPPHLDEDLPFVKKFNHGFQGPNGWFIEDCPTTLGEPCPVCKYNSSIWNSNEQRARNQKRKVSFYTNIMIIKDANCPDNNGKVFKYRFGIKIHDKIMEKIAPESDIDDPIQVFDYEKGANFKLKVKTQTIFLGGKDRPVPNYDASSFAEPSAINMDGQPLTDDEIDVLDAKLHKLNDLVKKENFKSYSDMAELFFKKTGDSIPTSPDGKAPADVNTTLKNEAPDLESFNDAPATEENSAEADADFFAKLRAQSE